MLTKQYYALTKDGSELCLRLTKPSKAAKAVLCLVHGQGDHGGCFEALREYYSSSSFAVLSIDLHGNGSSPGIRGHIDDYETLFDDIDLLLSQAQEQFPDLPVFLYGHSLGGNLVLNYVLRRKPEISGVIASSPWLSLAKNGQLTSLIAYILDKLKPNYILNAGINAALLSHDREYVKNYAQDPLIHGSISSHLLANACKSGKWAIHHASDFDLPLLLQHGSADPITSVKATKSFYKLAHRKNISLKIWEGDFHSLHNEANRLEIFNYVLSFLLSVIDEKENIQQNSILTKEERIS